MTEELFFRISFIAYYIALFVIAKQFRNEAKRAGSDRSKNETAKAVEGSKRIVRKIAGYLMITCALLYAIWPISIAWAALPIPFYFRLIAVIFAAFSLPFLIWVLKALGKQWSRQLTIQAEHELVTHGPYELVRHPLYTVMFVALISVGVISANALILFPALIAVFVILGRINAEEQQLTEAFPDAYPEYQRRTPKLIPTRLTLTRSTQ